MNSFEEVFENVKKYCLENKLIPDIAVTTWIGTMKPVSFNGIDAIFSVDTQFQYDVVTKNYINILNQAFLNLLGLNVNIIINVETDTTPTTGIPTEDELDKKNAELQQYYEFANYEYTFDTFIEGASNSFALAGCKSIVKHITHKPKEYNPLFIYGPSGMGKTHLITAIANAIREEHPEFNIVYVTSETFGNDLITALKTNLISDFHDKYRKADIP